MELGYLAISENDFETAKGYLTKSLDIRKQIDERDGETWILQLFGEISLRQGDFAGARTFYDASRVLCSEVKNEPVLCSALLNLGVLDWAKANYEKAKDDFIQALTIARRQGDISNTCSAFNYLGALALSQGDYAQAASWFEECLAFSQKVNDKVGVAAVFCELGNLAWVLGDVEQAAQKYLDSLNLIRGWGLGGIEIICPLRHGDHIA